MPHNTCAVIVRLCEDGMTRSPRRFPMKKAGWVCRHTDTQVTESKTESEVSDLQAELFVQCVVAIKSYHAKARIVHNHYRCPSKSQREVATSHTGLPTISPIRRPDTSMSPTRVGRTPLTVGSRLARVGAHTKHKTRLAAPMRSARLCLRVVISNHFQQV